MCCVCTFYYPCTHAGFLYQILSHNFGENSEGKPESISHVMRCCHDATQCHRVTPWHSPLSACGLGTRGSYTIEHPGEHTELPRLAAMSAWNCHPVCKVLTVFSARFSVLFSSGLGKCHRPTAILSFLKTLRHV